MKILNLFTLTLFISLLSLNAHAQKCSLDVDEVDQFTKQHVKSGSTKIGGLMKKMKLDITLKKTGTIYGWEMEMVVSGHVPEPIHKGDIFYCKLDNEKVIQLIADNEYAPVHAVSGNVILSKFVPKGQLDEAAIKTFSESPLSEVRITLSGNTVEPKVTGKQGSTIQEVARCLLLP